MPKETRTMPNPGHDVPPWPDLIVAMGELRRKTAQASNNLFRFTIPHVAATPEELAAAEHRLGHPLDPQHRAFLSYGNGWDEFFLYYYLLGANDLGQGPTWELLNEYLDDFYDSLPDDVNFPPRDEIYPITFNPESAQIFAIWWGGPIVDGGHQVVWIPLVDGDLYDNFFEFYQAIYQHYEKILEEETAEKNPNVS
ncbi:SMI1/KNR4 family protein [Crossiella sp. CA198]|uniref:SMI1/KNR4 family protein n=1 Tax=Crossiella sp. CA198 TaxID=3455607 RepID=UPI003F8D573E